MLLILLSWMYIVFTSINLGISFEKILKIEQNNFVVTTILGLFASTILGSIWAITGRINIEFHLFLLALNGILFYTNKNRIAELYSIFKKNIQQLSLFLKLFLGVSSLLILAQCAALPYVVDNESYYIQTIKWLNEYGFVKGLANLHIFFGQTSGWHITQSIFNFSFIYKNLNDLSGLCLLLGNTFAIIKLNEYFENQKKIYLIIGLLPLANALLFQFISAPSPDVPVYIFSFIVFFYFIEGFKKGGVSDFYTIGLLCLYILYCKPTSICILLLPLFYFSYHFKKLTRQSIPIIIIASLVFILYSIKNTILTGYALYPTQILSTSGFDFAVPKELISFYFDGTRLYGFLLTRSQFESMSTLQIFIQWLTINKINSLFNIWSCLLVLLGPYFIYKYYSNKAVWLLYTVMVLQLLVLLLSSPQFRFFIHFILVFSFLIISCIISNRKLLFGMLGGSLLIVVFLTFFTINLSGLTTNKLLSRNSSFRISSILLPAGNSKIDTQFYILKEGNLKYYSPDANTFFWISGNGPLPCVNAQQLEYFKTNFHFIPQMRGKRLKDGFYSKKIN